MKEKYGKRKLKLNYIFNHFNHFLESLKYQASRDDRYYGLISLSTRSL
jgi:hypothetical protein